MKVYSNIHELRTTINYNFKCYIVRSIYYYLLVQYIQPNNQYQPRQLVTGTNWLCTSYSISTTNFKHFRTINILVIHTVLRYYFHKTTATVVPGTWLGSYQVQVLCRNTYSSTCNYFQYCKVQYSISTSFKKYCSSDNVCTVVYSSVYSYSIFRN